MIGRDTDHLNKRQDMSLKLFNDNVGRVENVLLLWERVGESAEIKQ